VSNDIMNRFWWRKDLSTMEKFVAIALADGADDEGFCWPAVSTIAEKCACSDRTVQNAIKSLIGKMLLRKIERPNQSSYYFFNLANLPLIERERKSKERHPVSQTTGESGSKDLFSSGENDATSGESDVFSGAGDSPRNLKETSIETSTPESGDLVTISGLVEHIVNRWAEIRKRRPGVKGFRKIDDNMRRNIAARTRQHIVEGQTPIDVWNEALDMIERSSFLCGECDPQPGRSRFAVALPWMLIDGNFRKVINGNFSDKNGPSADRDRLGPTAKATLGALEGIRASRQRRGEGGDQGRDNR
jgi:hypothetical protein